MWVYMGADRAWSDSQIWSSSNLKGTIHDDAGGFSGLSTLPGDDKLYPYVIITDDAFAFRDWMMKLFGQSMLTEPECIFNQHLSRASKWLKMHAHKV